MDLPTERRSFCEAGRSIFFFSMDFIFFCFR